MTEKLTVKEQFLQDVKPEWHNEFNHFVETGEGSDQFLAYLNTDSGAQQAVERAFNVQAEAFQGLAKELKQTSGTGATSIEDHTQVFSDRITYAVEGALKLPLRDRVRVLQFTAMKLGATLGPEQARSLMQTFESKLEKEAIRNH